MTPIASHIEAFLCDYLPVDGGTSAALVDVLSRGHPKVPVKHTCDAYVLQTMTYKSKSADKARKKLRALVSWLERNGYDEAPEAFAKGWKRPSRL